MNDILVFLLDPCCLRNLTNVISFKRGEALIRQDVLKQNIRCVKKKYSSINVKYVIKTLLFLKCFLIST